MQSLLLLTCCFGSLVPSKFSTSKILNLGGNAIGAFDLFPYDHGFYGELLKLLTPFIFSFVLFIPFFHFLIIMDFNMWRFLELRFLQPSKMPSHFLNGLSMFVQGLVPLDLPWRYSLFLGGLLPLLGVCPQSWLSAFLSLKSKWEWGRFFLTLMVQWCLERSPIFIKFMSQ